MKYCCDMMRKCVEEMLVVSFSERFDDLYIPAFRCCGTTILISDDEGKDTVVLNYCPWCGKKWQIKKDHNGMISF